MRQAVFSSLGANVEGARFLDLFAGTGAYGLEALSRGASSGCFVEEGRRAVAALRDNLARVCLSAGAASAEFTIAAADVFAWLGRASGEFDLVFIDPPYDLIRGYAADLFAGCRPLLAGGGILIFEMPGESVVEAPGWSCYKRLGEGRRQATVAFYRATG